MNVFYVIALLIIMCQLGVMNSKLAMITQHLGGAAAQQRSTVRRKWWREKSPQE